MPKNDTGPTLKETLIDFADCNSTVGHLGSEAMGGALSLGTSDGYSALYQQIVPGLPYEDVLGQPGKMLRRLKPIYRGNTYWHRFFVSEETETYADRVWDKLVPVEARLAFHLDASPGTTASVKVSPVPRVILYPFGWSTWINLRVTGYHTLAELAELVHHLAEGPAYTLVPGPASPQKLREVFRHVAAGVWDDAFGGGKKKALSPLQVLCVTTVLDKFGGAPALQALAKEDEAALRRLVSPFGESSSKPMNDLKLDLPKGKEGAGNRDYALQDGHGVFIWADHLLKSDDRNRRLRCYHNNTFLSLLHAWQLSFFLHQAAGVKKKTDALAELVEKAVDQIEQPLTVKDFYYRNRCLISFLRRQDVQTAAQKAGAALGLKPAAGKGS